MLEQVFVKRKHVLRKAAARTVGAVGAAIGRVLTELTPLGCANYLKNQAIEPNLVPSRFSAASYAFANPEPANTDVRPRKDALVVMRSMADRRSDEHIAATLNQVGLRNGQPKTWTARRVSSVGACHAYQSAEKDGVWLTMSEATCRARREPPCHPSPDP